MFDHLQPIPNTDLCSRIPALLQMVIKLVCVCLSQEYPRSHCLSSLQPVLVQVNERLILLEPFRVVVVSNHLEHRISYNSNS